ncbi:uncharacterized protein LOC125501095 [Athalia rosae]|uniref:uncharacterized protein LOC125501095 n=1 Tax=Athalia rosae TaxID=37344 RepID=UPI0020334FDE|nr:uncharacterized protein LOC125501095 [Athalia rosae]
MTVGVVGYSTSSHRIANTSSSPMGSVPSGSTKGAVDITLRSNHSDDQIDLHAHVLQSLTVELPPVVIIGQSWNHIADLELADPDHLSPGRIDILIEADSYGLIIIKPGVITGNPSQPIAIQTVFGWAVLGQAGPSSITAPAHQGHLISNLQLRELVSRFWEQEEVPASHQDSLSAEEAECEAHFIATHSRDSSGRYIVRLPFKSNAPPLGYSKGIAQRSLSRLLHRIVHQPNLHHLYTEFPTEYESRGHMEKVQSPTASADVYHLPHHGVMRNNKIRVVFYGSSKTTSGYPLNELLHVGPKTQNDTFDVLLYVRRHRLIFTTDVEKLFRQILVHPDDRKFQRILWIDDHSQTQEFELSTVTYGTTSAPYLSGHTLRQLLLDEGHDFLLAAEPFEKGSYVDDISGGADDLDPLNTIANQVEEMYLRGCFPLAKWNSNHPDFFKLNLPHQPAWQCAPDLLKFTGQYTQRAAITKRTILSETAQLFDPLGLISPVIVRAKILMQDLWQEKVGWDDILTPPIIQRWTSFRDELSQLSQLVIPRWLNLRADSSKVGVHGFSDASQVAMAAAIYLEVTTLNGSSTSTLQLQHVPVSLWTDSAVTLAWINSDPMRCKEFVKDRVQEIQQTSPNAIWRFVSGKQNPADCASRGFTPAQLINHKLWWSGPDCHDSTGSGMLQESSWIQLGLITSKSC